MAVSIKQDEGAVVESAGLEAMLGDQGDAGEAPAGEGRKLTSYVVLVQADDEDDGWYNGGWFVAAEGVQAASARAAVDSVPAEAFGLEAGDARLVAVPVRSWRPVTVRVQTVTRRTVVG